MYEEPKPTESEQPAEPVVQQPVVKPAEYEPPVKPIEYEKPEKPEKKSDGKAILLILLVLILMGAAAAGAYWWRDNTANESKTEQSASIALLEKAKLDLEEQLATEKAKTADTTVIADETACTVQSPDATALENIKLSITSANTAALEGYMAASVNVILAATEGIGPSTPTAAISSISNFLTDDLTAWDYDFALPAATLSSYSSGGYGQYFLVDSVVGKATNGKVISFSFDCDAKISTVFMAASGEL